MVVDLLKTAGDAAQALERMGYTAVARRRAGKVTLEYWQLVGRRQYMMRHEVDDDVLTAEQLAQVCDAQFRAALPAER
jgi:hypothetical protein